MGWVAQGLVLCASTTLVTAAAPRALAGAPAPLALAVAPALQALAVAPALQALAVAPAPQVRVTDPRITESSGLAASPTDPDLVWTVNDSGDSARAFAVSLTTGRTVAVLKERTDARDCEAMASGRAPDGRPMLWIGDIGDNRAVRTSVVLRLVREPDPVRPVKVTPVSLRVRYPGGPSDAESLLWTKDGRLLIVTKGVLGGDVLQVPDSAVQEALAGHDVSTPVLARPVGSVSQTFPTDGVALPDGRLVIRDYQGATVYQPPAYDGKPLVPQTRLSFPMQDQGETVAAVEDGRALVLGSEGKNESLVRVAVPGAAPSGSTAATGTAASTGRPATSTTRAADPASTGTWLGRGLIGLAVLTVAGVGLHLLRGRRAAAARR